MKPVDRAAGGGDRRPNKGRKPKSSKCAVCGRSVVKAYRPFCSKRCADIDLWRWLKGEYAVAGTSGEAGEATDTEE
jgi:endogenous inhibitor of DNA gyrase (YacG/DUF329 family)